MGHLISMERQGKGGLWGCGEAKLAVQSAAWTHPPVPLPLAMWVSWVGHSPAGLGVLVG